MNLGYREEVDENLSHKYKVIVSLIQYKLQLCSTTARSKFIPTQVQFFDKILYYLQNYKVFDDPKDVQL